MMKTILRLLLTLIFLTFTFPFFIVVVLGQNKYKLKENTIIIANHYSNFDPFLIQLIFPFKKIRFVALKDTKRKIHLKFITWLFNAIYVDQESYDFSFIKSALKLLQKGEILCIFPEGVVNPSKFGFFDFKKSYLFLAKRANSTILPIYIYPRLNFFRKNILYVDSEITLNNADDVNKVNFNIMLNYIDYQNDVDNYLNNKK